jgi:hypothetical protein
MAFLIRILLPSLAVLAAAYLPLVLLLVPARAQEASPMFTTVEQVAASPY